MQLSQLFVNAARGSSSSSSSSSTNDQNYGHVFINVQKTTNIALTQKRRSKRRLLSHAQSKGKFTNAIRPNSSRINYVGLMALYI
jgi:hypothetical protein